MTDLLAKSVREGHPPKTLVGHTDDVLGAAEALFGREGAPTRLAESWLRFFNLARSDFGRFLCHLRMAAAAHDWAKANDGFQAVVSRVEGDQAVRHEHLAGLLLAELFSDKTVLDWLNSSGLDEILVLAAVVSHHVKAGLQAIRSPLIGTRETVTFLSEHENFGAIWRTIQNEVGSTCPTPVKFPSRWRKEDIIQRGRALEKLLTEEKKRLRDDPVRRRWVGAVRAALIVADSVGSAVVRMDRGDRNDALATIERWVQECFSVVLTGDDVWTKITKKRIADLRARGRWNDSGGVAFGDERGFNEFQVNVAAQGTRVLLTAPCGSGKTLAAWNWIKTQLDRRPAARVLFLYPTRATATEGFRDYVSWAPEDEAGLLSGTADYELQDMFTTPEDPGDPRKDRKYRSDPRLFALGHWKKRIFSATADQFFPFMQYGYGPLCLLPLLAESVLVVDEVHSFDKSMFSTLKRFLKEFPDVPVLCMTATLPVERRNDLIDDCKLKPYPELSPVDLVEDSGYPRYHIEWIDRAGAKELACGALNDRKRVLWVSNRVSDCQAVFMRFYDEGYIGPGSIAALCYHSRFKLKDRKEQHRQLIHAFQDAVRDGAPPQAVLGATTQVCEMSLDLDAEILVTELAPIASLIQRMGRCNRDSKKMKTRPIGRVYILRPEPGKEKPYEKEELMAAKEFVNKIAGRDVSQDELEAAYEHCDRSEVEPEKTCPFLDSGPYAEARREDSFRDIDEYTAPCVLNDDLPTVLALLRDRDPTARAKVDGYVVPVPRYLALEKRPDDTHFPPWLSVASGSRYDALIGFDDRNRPPTGGRDR